MVGRYLALDDKAGLLTSSESDRFAASYAACHLFSTTRWSQLRSAFQSDKREDSKCLAKKKKCLALGRLSRRTSLGRQAGHAGDFELLRVGARCQAGNGGALAGCAGLAGRCFQYADPPRLGCTVRTK